MNTWKNKLYYGDNLDIMRKHISDESVDLIYLDPPFNSKATYNVLFKEKNGTDSTAQITAFEDTWHWDMLSEATYHEVVTRGPRKLSDLLQAFRSFLGQNDMMAYLTMMAIRLVEMHRVLKSTGSIYLHCDPTASHYLKLVMDSIFNVKNYRNEIIWHYRTGNIAKKQFQRKHDILFFYSKSESNIFTPLEIKEYYVQLYGPQFRPSFKGRKHGSDKYGDYRYSFIDDVWDISAVFTLSKEHLDYPTQKPESLLERIINASSNEGDIVLDPFCGCGTTISVAERLNRRWIGIDITHLAITLIQHRLDDIYGQELLPYEIIGAPKDIESAKALAAQNRYQFEWWALSLVGARPAQDKKKGTDKGIDGIIYFFDDESGKAKKIVVQVKSGHVTVSQIRDLIGVVERENAAIGAFITLQEPTGPMKKEAAAAGFYETHPIVNQQVMHYPKIQIITIEELLNEKFLSYPEWSLDATHKKAERRKKKENENQIRLL